MFQYSIYEHIFISIHALGLGVVNIGQYQKFETFFILILFINIETTDRERALSIFYFLCFLQFFETHMDVYAYLYMHIYIYIYIYI